ERRFSVHRLVLAAGSEFFRLMFTSMQDIIKLNRRNVQSLLQAACQYQIEPIQLMCEEFLKEQMDIANCMGKEQETQIQACCFDNTEPLIVNSPQCLSMVTGNIMVAFMQDSKWTAIHCSLEKRLNATAVYWDDEVYILGGSTCQGFEKRIDCYNIPHQRMYSRMEMPSPRNKLAACVCQGKIYISGGIVQSEYGF
ncbi:hypothetical protein XENOCAPTIV_015739, partial [Xenoophorus captivus]